MTQVYVSKGIVKSKSCVKPGHGCGVFATRVNNVFAQERPGEKPIYGLFGGRIKLDVDLNAPNMS